MARNIGNLRTSKSSAHLTDDNVEPVKINIEPITPQTFPRAIRSFQKKEENTRKHRICIISDFFFPKKGGVETHMYNLA